jgi:hypothetical protein
VRDDAGIRRAAGLDILYVEKSAVDTRGVGDVWRRGLSYATVGPTLLLTPLIFPVFLHMRDGNREMVELQCLSL